MKKKQYKKPELKEVKVRRRAALLQSSDDLPNAIPVVIDK